MANQFPDAETTRDLEALPADLRPLYRRLAYDGATWQAASAPRLATLAQSLMDDIQRMAPDSSSVTSLNDEVDTLDTTAPVHAPPAPIALRTLVRRRREWLFGTLAAVAVVALLALVFQGALAGRGTTGPTSPAGHWQTLANLTVNADSVAAQPPVIAPNNPQVVYEPTNSISGQGGKAVTYASLRRSDDGGKTWRALTLPLPVAAVEMIQLQVSPLNAQTVFMSLWDRTSITCEPTNGTVGEGCERGYISTNGGDTWQTQTLPVRGILDLSQPFAIQQNRLFARNVCNGTACIHLLISADGGRSWQVIDDQLVANGRYVYSVAATPNGGTVYAVTVTSPQVSAMMLWRSDDAGSRWGAADEGTHWTSLGALPTQTQGAVRLWPTSASLLSSPTVGLVYLNLLHAPTNAEPQFLYSEDYGQTWKSSPAVPAVTRSPLGIVSSAAMHDGTLVVAIYDGASHSTLYTWKPGERAWTRLPSLPSSLRGAASVMVAPGGSWQDTIIVIVRDQRAPGSGAYYVARYQM